MKILRLLSIAISLYIYIVNVYSRDVIFNQLKSDFDGLHYSVNSLYKDERGFIWVGSRNGLSLFNGSSISTFKYDKNNNNSIANNNIHKITGDGSGKVFLKASNVVTIYDYENEIFTRIPFNNCRTIYFNKNLFVTANNSIYVFDDTTNKFEHYFSLPSRQATISAIYINNDSLWIGTTNEGLYLKHKNVLNNIIAQSNITSIYIDSENNTWVGSWENGAFKLNNNEIVNYRNSANNPQSISSDFTRDFCEDNQGNMWIGTYKGISKYDKKLNTITNYYSNENLGSLSNSSIWSMIKDNQGTIWIGTYFGGVNYFNPEYEIFTKYLYSTQKSNKNLNSPIIGMMTEDNNNNLWICTDGGGINILNRKTHTFTTYTAGNSQNSISSNNVKTIYYDEKLDVMWAGTHLGGLNKINLKTGKVTQLTNIFNNAKVHVLNIISHIIPYNNNLLLATHNGIYIFDPQTNKATLLNEKKIIETINNRVNYLHIDRKGILWIAGRYLYAYNFKTKNLKEYKHNKNGICSNNISIIYEDNQNTLWFGSEDSGFDKYLSETDQFENFDINNSTLLSNCIYMISEFTNDQLIISTDKGISIFNKHSKQIINYATKNGIPLETTNSLATYKTADETMYVGGVDGLISFKTKDLKFEPQPYEIFPTNLFVNGHEIKPNDDTKILNKAISNTKEITLNSKQSIFSIEFTTTNYISLYNSEIIYKLEGFSNEWNSVQGQNIITYTNLNPGKYKLIIKPKHNDHLCNQSEITINILPPFYKTYWAYLIYLIIIALIIKYLNNIYKSRIKLTEKIKYEQKRVEDIEKLNQSKLNFFTNISHEFRTPLTLIIGQLEMLIQSKSFVPNVYNRILSVYNNSLQLRELISELLDFRKQEQGEMKIFVSENNIIEFLSENYHFFLEYARNKNINFEFNWENEKKEINIWFDSKQMQKVINNLLSNSFKNTPKGGNVSINVREFDETVEFSISDTGLGIHHKDIENVFEMFYQSENIEHRSIAGTGIGLALVRNIIELHKAKISVKSELGVGSTFTVTLLKGNEQFNKEQICNNTNKNWLFEKQCDEDTKNINEPSTSNIDSDTSTKDSKLLIVEDNSSLREMLKNIFDPFFDVYEAEDGEIGLAMVYEIMPNIVVSDVLMPKLSGIELCKTIKNNIDTCHIPVVLLTARTAIEHNLEGLKIGADDYITKPFNVNLLLTRCNNLINSRIMLQEKFSNNLQTPLHILATNAMDKDVLDKASLIIEKYIDDCDFSIDTFAKEMGMARTKLFAKIKSITGQTPFEFISTIKLKKAALMLRNNPELNITEISERLGFNTPRYFSKCFKDKYNIIPLEYRKKHQTSTESENATEQ